MLKNFFINLRLFISPFFLNRFYLARDISKILKAIKLEGKLIDIGCGQKPYKKMFMKRFPQLQYLGIDFPMFSLNKDFNASKPDFYFNSKYLENFTLPFKSNCFNHVVSFQVMEHHKKPEIFIKEIVRIVKRGGYIIISFPFIWGLHELPSDYYRYTEFLIDNLLKANNCTIIKIFRQGTFLSTVSMLANEEINTFASKNWLNYVLSLFFYPFFLLYQYFCLFADFFISSNTVFFNYLIFAKKNG